MSIKKHVLFLLFLFNVFSAHARWEPNLVLGVSGGWIRDVGMYNNTIYTGLPGLGNFYADDANQEDGYFAGLLGGFEAINAGWLVGLELHINRLKMDHHRYFESPYFNFWSFDGKLKHGTDYGLFMRLGYTISDYFLPYMHIGGETSQDSLDMLISETLPGSPQRNILLHDKRWTYRFTGGVGAEFPIPCTCSFSFRIEYMFHLPGTRLSADAMDSVTHRGFSTDIKPRTQSVEAAIVWNL